VFAATPSKHGWDTVADMMGMHGSYSGKAGDSPDQAGIDFVANNYATITVGTGCSDLTNSTHTFEDEVLFTATKIKAANADASVGIYLRTDFALELAGCSHFSAEWAAHPDYYLKYDNGSDVMNGKFFFIDYTNPDASAFFARSVVSNMKPMLSSGKPVLDYVYLDGDPVESDAEKFKPGISADRSAKIVAGYYACFADIQRQLDAMGFDQKVILNGMDDAWAPKVHVATGTAGSMVDHWTILQFLDTKTGAFNVPAMEGLIEMTTSALTANITKKIKGWPGPIVGQRDHYPANIPTPKTPAEFQKVLLKVALPI
jgi:hypothetical protein